jgi:hypothetical protein
MASWVVGLGRLVRGTVWGGGGGGAREEPGGNLGEWGQSLKRYVEIWGSFMAPLQSPAGPNCWYGGA